MSVDRASSGLTMRSLREGPVDGGVLFPHADNVLHLGICSDCINDEVIGYGATISWKRDHGKCRPGTQRQQSLSHQEAHEREYRQHRALGRLAPQGAMRRRPHSSRGEVQASSLSPDGLELHRPRLNRAVRVEARQASCPCALPRRT